MCLSLYEDNTDIHLSAYLLPCVNEVLFTVSVHVYIYIYVVHSSGLYT